MSLLGILGKGFGIDSGEEITLSSETIDQISARIASDLSTNAIVVNSPFAIGGAMTLITGDDYVAENGTSIRFTVSGRSDLVGLIPHLLGESGTTTFEIVAPAIISSGQTITFGDLTSAVTSTLKSGTRENPHEGTYQVQFFDLAGKRITQAEGVMFVRRGLSA